MGWCLAQMIDMILTFVPRKLLRGLKKLWSRVAKNSAKRVHSKIEWTEQMHKTEILQQIPQHMARFDTVFLKKAGLFCFKENRSRLSKDRSTKYRPIKKMYRSCDKRKQLKERVARVVHNFFNRSNRYFLGPRFVLSFLESKWQIVLTRIFWQAIGFPTFGKSTTACTDSSPTNQQVGEVDTLQMESVGFFHAQLNTTPDQAFLYGNLTYRNISVGPCLVVFVSRWATMTEYTILESEEIEEDAVCTKAATSGVFLADAMIHGYVVLYCSEIVKNTITFRVVGLCPRLCSRLYRPSFVYFIQMIRQHWHCSFETVVSNALYSVMMKLGRFCPVQAKRFSLCKR